MRRITELVSTLTGLFIFCSILAVAIDYISSKLFGIDIEGTPLFWILPIMAIVLMMGLVYLIDYMKTQKKLNVLCPHGIPGGDVQRRCSICNQKRDDLIREENRMQALNRKAEEVLNKEIERVLSANLQKEQYLRGLSPREFEDVVAEMFRKLGYIVEQTPYVNDHGKDAILFKDGKKVLLECKLYASDKTIGRPQLQKFFAAMVEEKADKGLFVNTGTFTKTAYEYGINQNIELIGVVELLKLMKQTHREESNPEEINLLCRECGELVSFDLNKNEKTAICSNGHLVSIDDFLKKSHTSKNSQVCPLCGHKLRLINGPHGKFWGCAGYPKCSYTKSK